MVRAFQKLRNDAADYFNYLEKMVNEVTAKVPEIEFSCMFVPGEATLLFETADKEDFLKTFKIVESYSGMPYHEDTYREGPVYSKTFTKSVYFQDLGTLLNYKCSWDEAEYIQLERSHK